MIIATPGHDELCAAPELAILAALEVSLAVTTQILGIAHYEFFEPGADPRYLGLDAKIAAAIIAQASNMIATINRYRLALVDPDACDF